MFDTLVEVNNRIQNNDCMSGVGILLAETMYGVIFQSKTIYNFHPLEFEDDCGFHSMNLLYVKTGVKDEYIISFLSKEQLSSKISDYISAVPFDPNFIKEVSEYSIISKNWKCCDVSNTLSIIYSPSVYSLNEMIHIFLRNYTVY